MTDATRDYLTALAGSTLARIDTRVQAAIALELARIADALEPAEAADDECADCGGPRAAHRLGWDDGFPTVHAFEPKPEVA